MPEVVLTDELKQLLDDAGLSASDLATKLTGGAWYTTLLELGSSRQQPNGIFAGHRPEYETLLETAMQKALEKAIADNQPLGPALMQGFVNGVTEILRAIELNTPVKTGRARSSWVATLSNGKTIKAIRYTGDEAAYQRRLRLAKKRLARGTAGYAYSSFNAAIEQLWGAIAPGVAFKIGHPRAPATLPPECLRVWWHDFGGPTTRPSEIRCIVQIDIFVPNLGEALAAQRAGALDDGLGFNQSPGYGRLGIIQAGSSPSVFVGQADVRTTPGGWINAQNDIVGDVHLVRVIDIYARPLTP